MSYGPRPVVVTQQGGARALGVREPDSLSTPGSGRSRPSERGGIMSKWKTAQESMIVRVTVSAGSIIAIAAVVGAGVKWK